MQTHNHIHFSQISEILMQAALGVSAVCGYKYTVSDMVISLGSLLHKIHSDDTKSAFYIAIREQGTEEGSKEDCIERCKGLGYPLVIAKIEADKVCDYNLTITFTEGWNNGDIKYMEQEFNSL